MAKFNTSGVHQWSQRFGDPGEQYAQGLAIAGSGNVSIAGQFGGTVNFGGSNLTSAGSHDICLASFNTSGVHQWSQRFGDASTQFGYAVATDGAGSVYLAGEFGGMVNFGGATLTSAAFYNAYLAKFNAAGVHQWSQRFGDTNEQKARALTTDGSGNVLLAGMMRGTVNFGGSDLTSAGSDDIYLAKFDAMGVHQWSQRFGDASVQEAYALTTDSSGRVYLTGDFQSAVNFGGSNLLTAGNDDIFLATFGGVFAEPEILGITDVANDQGRRVRVQIAPSGLDDAAAVAPIQQYEAFRRVDPLPSAPRPVIRDASTAVPSPVSIAPITALPPGDWEFAAAIPAHAEETYFMLAPTLADSTISAGQYHSVFFIRAATSVPSIYYDSVPDSGYSLDNLAPGVPASLAYGGGNLTWQASTAPDFDYFTVYGSSTPSFASATLINETVTPAMNVSASPYSHYFVTATDFSGNEGNPATSSGVTGVDGTPKNYVLSVSAYPNPFKPRTTIRYTLPSKGRLTIAIYAANGERVSTLVDEEKPAGAYTVPWDGRSDAGVATSSGVYFARIEFANETRAHKMVVLK